MVVGKQHLSFGFNVKSKCWIAERKKKRMKIKAALLRRGSQKHVAGDAAEHFSRGLGVIDLHFEWAERLCHGVTANIRVHVWEAGRRDSPWQRHRDSHQIGRSSQVGAVSQRRLVKVNDHDVHFACQTRRRREIMTQRFWNFALMCKHRRLWRVLN